MIPAELLTRYEAATAVDMPENGTVAPDMAERSMHGKAERMAEMGTAGWSAVGTERWLYLPAALEPAARIETEHGTVLVYAP